jgi:hypothetical protein
MTVKAHIELSEFQLDKLLEERHPFDKTKPNVEINNYYMYIPNQTMAEEIQDEIDNILGIIGLLTDYRVSWEMDLSDEHSSFYRLWAKNDKKKYSLTFETDGERNLRSVVYNNPYAYDERRGKIKETGLKAENPYAGVFIIFDDFKRLALNVKQKKSQASKDYKPVKVAKHRVKVKKEDLILVQGLLDQIASLASQKGYRHESSSQTNKDGTRTVQLTLKGKTMPGHPEPSRWTDTRRVDFIINKDTNELIKGDIYMDEHGYFRYFSTANIKRMQDEIEHLKTLDFFQKIQWLIDNKL